MKAVSTKSATKHLFVVVETEILFCNIKKVAHKRAAFGRIGAIYVGLYKKYRPEVINPTPFLDYITGRRAVKYGLFVPDKTLNRLLLHTEPLDQRLLNGLRWHK